MLILGVDYYVHEVWSPWVGAEERVVPGNQSDARQKNNKIIMLVNKRTKINWLQLTAVSMNLSSLVSITLRSSSFLMRDNENKSALCIITT